MTKTIIAAAQTIPCKGNITRNIEAHCNLINIASRNNVQLIIFPELSLTGYEPGLANDLAFSMEDKRLIPLQKLSAEKNIIIVAGAPLRLENALHITSFILFPDNSLSIYTKHHLHAGEEKIFESGICDLSVKLNEDFASLAICADTNNPSHPENASKNGSTIYMASSFITPLGYLEDTEKLKHYAGLYKMTVLFSNFGGDSGGFKAAGQSAVYNTSGKVISKLNEQCEGIVIGVKENNTWTGQAILA